MRNLAPVEEGWWHSLPTRGLFRQSVTLATASRSIWLMKEQILPQFAPVVPSLPALGKASQQRAAVDQLLACRKGLESLERSHTLNFGVSVFPNCVYMDEKERYHSRSACPGIGSVLSLTGLREELSASPSL